MAHVPLHFSQYFNLKANDESAFDFFDANLEYDSPLFIDPFLIRKSDKDVERLLFSRFGIFFKIAYSKYLNSQLNGLGDDVYQFLCFKEPKNIMLGYSNRSNEGRGLSTHFAKAVMKFFSENTLASLFMNDEEFFPDGQFNPSVFSIFSDGVGPDGLSDLSANLLMDYLVSFTQEQCEKWEVPMKKLRVDSYFDFELEEWDSSYELLPENPYKKGNPIILVPKHFLRVDDNDISSDFVSFLKTDDRVQSKFTTLIDKNVSELKKEKKQLFERLRDVIREDKSIVKSFLSDQESKVQKYDFVYDTYEILSISRYYDYFSEYNVDRLSNSSNCGILLQMIEDLINEFRKECELRDGWKDCWKEKDPYKYPVREEVIGRKFRGMGFARFKDYDLINFLPEVGTGNGYVDFFVTFDVCKVSIELKKLSNANLKGAKKVKAYLHGVMYQLPQYIKSNESNYGIYLTILHFTSLTNDHTSRIKEVDDTLLDVQKDLTMYNPNFKELRHYTVDVSPKNSASEI